MRLAFDGTPLLGARSGVGWYTYELIRAVADAAPEDELLVLPISWRTARHLDAPPGRNVRAVKRIAPARPLRYLWNRVAFPPLELFVRAQLFHATNFVAPPSWRTPVVVTVHDIGFKRDPSWAGPRERELIDLLPRSLARAAAVITVSDFTRRELIEWLPWTAPKIHVVPSAPHTRRPSSTVDRAGRPFALVLGSINPRKNVPLAIEAIALLARRGVDLDLVLAGAPSGDVDVARVVANHGLEGRVRVTGYVDDDAMSSLLASAAVLAFPSRYEGFGMPLLEAMQAGVPVVAVDAGATPEIVGDAALLVPDDAEAFANALAAAAFDAATRQTLTQRGSQRAAEFSWERCARETRDVYLNVLSG